MFCHRCGDHLISEAQFCASCGAPSAVARAVLVASGVVPSSNLAAIEAARDGDELDACREALVDNYGAFGLTVEDLAALDTPGDMESFAKDVEREYYKLIAAARELELLRYQYAADFSYLGITVEQLTEFSGADQMASFILGVQSANDKRLDELQAGEQTTDDVMEVENVDVDESDSLQAGSVADLSQAERSQKIGIAIRYLLEHDALVVGCQARLAEHFGVSRQSVHRIVVKERRLMEQTAPTEPITSAAKPVSENQSSWLLHGAAEKERGSRTGTEPKVAESPVAMASDVGPRYAEFGWRSVAFLVDAVTYPFRGVSLTLVLAYVSLFVSDVLDSSLGEALSGGDRIWRAAEVTGSPWGLIVLALIASWWYLDDLASGQTTGCRVAGVRVQREADGAKPGLSCALLRTAVSVVSRLPLWLGYWSMAWDAKKRTWHDRAAGTVVVRDYRPFWVRFNPGG